MKIYKQSEILIQLFQISPSNSLLNKSVVGLIETLLKSKMIDAETEQGVMIKGANTFGELLNAVQGDSKVSTWVMNQFLAANQKEMNIDWNHHHRGIRISDEVVLKSSKYRGIKTSLIAQLRADKVINGVPFFTVIVKNPLYFTDNLQLDDFSEFLSGLKGKLFLPAYDSKNKFNNVVRSVNSVEIYKFQPKSRKYKDHKPKRYGEMFMQSGRMDKAEYDELTESQDKFPICTATSYSNYSRFYTYPARDVEIIASDSLIKLKNNNASRQFPDELQDAIELYIYAKSLIREQMDARKELLDKMMVELNNWFSMSDPVKAECNYLMTPRYRLKNRKKIKDEVALGTAYYTDGVSELGVNALCYPRSESTPEQEEKFLKFFGKTSKVRDIGFEFTLVPFSSKMAVQDPVATAERIVKESNCNAALVVWRNIGYLPNNKPLEFELMRRGVAVQNVIDQGFKVNAPKISSLIKGMTEKFPINECHAGDSTESIKPFDFVLGLDVSRHGNLDIASFPIIINEHGQISCKLSDTPYTKDKEKRSEEEILSIITNLINDSPSEKEINILFLRDGIAFEDYSLIASKLPDYVSLTVVSVRKNLLNTYADEMPEGDFYSLYADHDDKRFVFGVNARQGAEAKVTRMHLAEVIENPLKLDNRLLGRILISLACQNKTTEVEITSLPFPIAYADRMAWTMRDMLQDNSLARHVSDSYPEEVSEAGGATMFIYQTLKTFIETRANGYSFAI